MTLRTRLALGLMAVALVFVVPLIIALRSIERLRAQTQALRGGEFATSLLLSRMRRQAEEVRRADDVLFVDPSDATRPPYLASELRRLATMADSLRGRDRSAGAAELRAAVARLDAALPLELAALTSGDVQRADSLSADAFRPGIAHIQRLITTAEQELGTTTARRVDDAADAAAAAQAAAVTTFGGALLLATLIAVGLTRSISRPLRDLELGMQAVAGGEFAHRLSVAPNRRDEFGRLALSYQSMATQLAELDKLKAEFVSIASHELKTPINVIMGYVQLLDEGVFGPLSPKQSEILGTLETQCESLARLVKQLLDVSRFEAGGGKLEPRNVALADFLNDLEAAFTVLAMQRSISFQVHRDAALPTDVQWDVDRMNEVLGNLLSNAFKFTERGGRVELRVRAGAAPDTLRMDVRDSGAGIPAAQLPHVFEKFYQADNQDSASAKGTGLGLAIAKGIVEAHAGTIDVQSEAGIGTTFTIVLPRRIAVSRRIPTIPLAALGATAPPQNTAVRAQVAL